MTSWITEEQRDRLDDLTADSLDIIDRAVEEHSQHVAGKVRTGFALFSGGHDSLAATLVAMDHPKVRKVAHINTGIGVEETRQYVRDTCTRMGWPLVEMSPENMPVGSYKTYEELVMKYGFPGPGAHRMMYANLKEKPLSRLVNRTKERKMDRVMLITGVRRDESRRRMGTVQDIKREGSRLWVAPLIDWTKRDCSALIALRGVPRNPVVDALCMSGECLCGAYATPGEMEELEMWYPETAQRIHDLEARAREVGAPNCVWGQKPIEGGLPATGPLCHGCDERAEVES